MEDAWPVPAVVVLKDWSIYSSERWTLVSLLSQFKQTEIYTKLSPPVSSLCLLNHGVFVVYLLFSFRLPAQGRQVQISRWLTLVLLLLLVARRPCNN